MIRDAREWQALYRSEEARLAQEGIEPSFSKMKSKTEVYERKNQLNVVERDGQYVTALFIVSLLAYALYWWYTNKRKPKTAIKY